MKESQELRVIDANIILRFLVNDLPEQAERCAELLKRLETGMEQVLLPDLVLADIVWTLEKFYKLSKREIRDIMASILALKGLQFSSKAVAREAFQFYVEKNIDWTDAFVSSQMMSKKRKQIYSYDRDFDKIPGIYRIEP